MKTQTELLALVEALIEKDMSKEHRANVTYVSGALGVSRVEVAKLSAYQTETLVRMVKSMIELHDLDTESSYSLALMHARTVLKQKEEVPPDVLAAMHKCLLNGKNKDD